MTIVLLNVGNVVWFATCVLSNIITESFDWEWDFDSDDHWSYEFFYVTFFDSVMAQCILAAYNPLIFCLRKSGIRDMMRGLCRGRGRETVYQTGSSEVPPSGNTGSFYQNKAGSLRRMGEDS